MQIGGKPERVKLNTNLERYADGLLPGIEGWTIPNRQFSMWGSQDRFVAVKFDNGVQLDILYKNLDFLESKSNKEVF